MSIIKMEVQSFDTCKENLKHMETFILRQKHVGLCLKRIAITLLGIPYIYVCMYIFECNVTLV